MKQALISAAFAAALFGAGGAYAATPSPQQGKPPAYADPAIADADAMKAADQINRMPLAQMLKQQLAQAGLTDISIKSATFIVHAKTKAGKPLVLAIGPNGVSEIVKVTAPVVAEQSH
jgi:hypothetical protein